MSLLRVAPFQNNMIVINRDVMLTVRIRLAIKYLRTGDIEKHISSATVLEKLILNVKVFSPLGLLSEMQGVLLVIGTKIRFLGRHR